MADDKTDAVANARAKQGKEDKSPPSRHGEAMQRFINRQSNHSERVHHTPAKDRGGA
jgi:hypothetical protein